MNRTIQGYRIEEYRAASAPGEEPLPVLCYYRGELDGKTDSVTLTKVTANGQLVEGKPSHWKVVSGSPYPEGMVALPNGACGTAADVGLYDTPAGAVYAHMNILARDVRAAERKLDEAKRRQFVVSGVLTKHVTRTKQA